VKQREGCLERLKVLAGEYADSHPGTVIGRIAFFRGDSWQCCMARPGLAVETAVFFRAGLKATGNPKLKLDTRIGIGIGAVDKLNRRNITLSSGPAFNASGAALDEIGKRRMGILFEGPGGEKKHSPLLETALSLLDALINRWSARESLAAYGVLSGWTQEQTAGHPLARTEEDSQPTRQSIADALARIDWDSAIQPSLDAIRNHFDGGGE